MGKLLGCLDVRVQKLDVHRSSEMTYGLLGSDAAELIKYQLITNDKQGMSQKKNKECLKIKSL